MRKILFTVFGLMVGFALMGMAFAQFKLPRKQKGSPPPSQKSSPTRADCGKLQKDYEACKKTPRYTTKGDNCKAERDALRTNKCPVSTGPCTEGAIRNQMYCPNVTPLVPYRQYVCRNGRYVWEDRMNQADCPQPQPPAQQPPQVPAEQAPAEQPPAEQAEQQEVQCTDSDNSQVVDGRLNLGGDRLVRGTVRGRSRVDGGPGVSGDLCMPNGTLLEYFCANATDIGGSTVRCEGGEVCMNGACREPEPIVLNRCGTPAGGWQNWANYVLSSDIEKNEYAEGEESCLSFRDASNITLDCNGHTIRAILPDYQQRRFTNGILIAGLSNITIRRCTIRDFGTGIQIDPTFGSVNISDNNISGNITGLFIRDSNNAVFERNEIRHSGLGGGVQLFPLGHQANNNYVFRRNTISENPMGGFYLANTQNSEEHLGGQRGPHGYSFTLDNNRICNNNPELRLDYMCQRITGSPEQLPPITLREEGINRIGHVDYGGYCAGAHYPVPTGDHLAPCD